MNARARKLYSAIRGDLGLPVNQWQGGSFTELTLDTREDLEDELQTDIAGSPFFQRENPFVRHVVLRKRTTLEDEGLLKKIGVDLHPNSDFSREVQIFHSLFEGLALRTSDDFREAYTEARNYNCSNNAGERKDTFSL